MIEKLFYTNLILFIATIVILNILNAVSEGTATNDKCHMIIGLWVFFTLFTIPAFIIFNIWG